MSGERRGAGPSQELIARAIEAAHLRAVGNTQAQIGAALGVGQPTVSTDLRLIDSLATEQGVELENLTGATVAGAARINYVELARRLAPSAVPRHALAGLARRAGNELASHARVLASGVILAREWTDPSERGRAVEDLLGPLSDTLQALGEVIVAIDERAAHPARLIQVQLRQLVTSLRQATVAA